MAYLGEDIKKLGFGLMRLPMQGGDIDIEQTKQMVDLFLERGFTYFDTAWGYNNGESEIAAGKALVKRHPRESFQLATKLPAWAAADAEAARQMLQTSLERCGTDYFDFYLLHNLGGNRTEVFEKYGIFDYVLEQKREGRIRHAGFSMHAKAAELDTLLGQHPELEFVQLQINYADWDDEIIESRKCYEVARKHNKPVIIMEPVKGGALATLPPQAASILQAANPNASQASWAIRFAASLPGLITVLSGMSSLAQMQDNLSFMEHFEPLTGAEQQTIAKVQQVLADIPTIPCTDCQYCMKGCPQNINIPGTFDAMNDYLVYQDVMRAKRNYSFATMRSGKASECIACGQCEEVCPQSIHIIDELARSVQVVEG